MSIELYASYVTVGFDLGHDLDPEFSRSNMEFAISQPKLVRLPRNEKQLYIDWTSNVTIQFDLGHDLDLEFSRSNMEFAISQPKMVRLPRNEKQTYWLNSRPQMWPSGLTLAMTLTLHFEGLIWNLLYLSQNWSDCHETKSNYISIELQMWPFSLTLAMTLTLNFQGQIWPWPLTTHMALTMDSCISEWEAGWVGLWSFLWWAPWAKRKDHHGVSSGWSSIWVHSNNGLSSTQYEQIPIIFGVWPFCRSVTFWLVYD